MTRWAHALFDLDGTLANTIELIIGSYQHAVREVLGQEVVPAEARDWIGEPLSATFARRYPGFVEELTEAYLVWNQSHMASLLTDYPGIVELLGDLRVAGTRVGVVTSKRRASAERTLSLVGLEIPVLIAMEDTATHKPEPGPLLAAIDALGISAGEAVYIGDAVVDVLAARAAGLASVAVTWGAGLPAALETARPDVMVDTVAELRDVLLD